MVVCTFQPKDLVILIDEKKVAFCRGEVGNGLRRRRNVREG